MGLCLSYNYRPNKNHGSDVGYSDPDLGYVRPTEADIKECIQYGGGYACVHKLQRYRDMQEYMRYYNLYMPLS